MDWSVSEVQKDDVPNTTFQQFEVTVEAAHDFIDGLHKIFLPLLVIALASISFMHLNHVAQGSYASPRIGEFVTLILTCMAPLKLALRGELPVVHYGTLTDALFNLTIVMLLIGLISSCYLATLATSGKEQRGRHLHDRFKWGYPALYAVAVGLVCVQFFIRL